MQVELYLEDVTVYNAPTGLDEGTYRVKVHIMPIDLYLDFKFVLFHAHKGEYGLYPGSYKEKSTDKWKDKFEYGKQSSFYRFLLGSIIDEVESYSGVIINRTHNDKHYALQEDS